MWDKKEWMKLWRYRNPERLRVYEKKYKRKIYMNRPDVKERSLARNRIWKKERKTFLLTYVRALKENTSCTDCHNFYPHYVMEFDHLADKNYSICELAQRAHSFETLLKEVIKCEVVCSNCHAERTWSRLHAERKV